MSLMQPKVPEPVLSLICDGQDCEAFYDKKNHRPREAEIAFYIDGISVDNVRVVAAALGWTSSGDKDYCSVCSRGVVTSA